MQRPPILILLFVLGCRTEAPTRGRAELPPQRSLSVELGREETWSRLIGCLSILQIQPEVLDPKGGVILASGATPLGDIIDCGPRPRSPADYFEECRYSLCIVMDAVSETSSLVTVRLEGNVTLHSMQYSYFLGIPLWYVSDELTCTSTGRLEHDLFACLRH